jgi:predicted  nucleic acid-binding Zn-ribbon protein
MEDDKMQKMTSAYANKMLKSLEEDKAFWVNKEETSSTYVVANNEEPVVPEYDYMQVANTIAEIDEKIAVIKHALNVANATAKVMVGDVEMSIDTILIRMAQLNKRKNVLDVMRKRLPKAREDQRSYMSRNTVPEYRYINYDLDLIKEEYESVSKVIMEMQMALDRYNQTVQFEVDM